MGFEYKVTVIIPVYNAEQYLAACLDSLLAQTISQAEMEVLMINDGSPDGSLAICERYAKEHENFRVISQENQGVSAARNTGIRNAKGKYLLYLDSDDTLSPETAKNVTDFFDEHYDEVDVVGYPILFCYADGRKVPHGRDKILLTTGIYDAEETLYTNLTTINVAVKNRKAGNSFFDDGLFYHEDEAYLADVVMSCRKFGYVQEAAYFYAKTGNGVSDQKVSPYFIFDPTMALYERMFREYRVGGGVSKYIQAMVLNDLGWKIRTDAVFPYHYSAEEFQAATERIKNLLEEIDDTMILNHPGIDIYHRYYILSLKSWAGLRVFYGKNALVLCRNEQALAVADSITIVITKIAIKTGYVEFQGFLKSPFFLFSEKPELHVMLTTNQEQHKEKISLVDSMHGYYKSRIKTAQFWHFNFRVSSQEDCTITPSILLKGKPLHYKFYYMPGMFFQNTKAQQTVCNRGIKCMASGQGFSISRVTQEEQSEETEKKNRWYWKHNKKFWLVRKLATLGKHKKHIWLYYDSTGTGCDNGYYQFIHDIQQSDGIIRYYVTHDKNFADSENFNGIPKRQVVLFGSKRHKFLYLWCEKVITAYVESYNYIPFDWKTYGNYRDIGEPEIIYLQHGVLHAHMPRKYSFERLNIDREVVSTFYEIENLTKNYQFKKENLILAGMPRYDYIPANIESSRKILLAPSWREYLISMQDGNWKPEDEKFKASGFYKSLQKFLQSEELTELLETYDYTLDLKLHPIFHCYQKYFSSSNPRINLAATNTDASQYSIFISDFSSFTFDFVYQKRTILYFFPDYDMFRAGMMSYRQLDIPLENGFGPLTQTAEEALLELKKILHNGGKPEEQYLRRMNNFFLFYDDGQRDRIYQALIQGKTGDGKRPLIEDLLKDNL